MCVIVVKPKGVKLKEKYWAECFRVNGHGAGLTYVDDNKLVVDKGYFKFDDLYKEITKHEDKEMIVHFRIASAGSIKIENCHPFFVQGELFKNFSFSISHNGTLPWRSTKEESDTCCFVYDLLGPQLDMHPWFLDFLPGRTFVSRFCGERNKLAIMRYDNKKKESKIYIINKEAGVEDMGCWFSNASYRLPVIYHSHRAGLMFGDDYWPENDRHLHALMSDKDWSKYGFHLRDGKWIPNRIGGVRQANQVPPARSVMPTLGDGKDVVVPRDINLILVAEAEAKEKERMHRMNSKLEHLTKKEKQIFRRMANDLARETMEYVDAKHTPLAELVDNLRETYRWSTKDEVVALMEDTKLDKFIVEEFKKTGKNPEFIDNPSMDVEEPDRPDEIDEAVGAREDLGKVEQFPRGDPVQPGAATQEFDKS